MKKQILKWFNGNRNYNEGLNLFQNLSSNRLLLLKLNRGYSKDNAEKLIWELHKIAELPDKFCYDKPVTNDTTVITVIPKKKGITNYIKNSEKKNINENPLIKNPASNQIQTVKNNSLKEYKDLPDSIKKLIEEKGKLIRNRAATHTEMEEISGNSAKEKQLRKKMRDEINLYTERINEITDQVVAYDLKGILPDEKKPLIPVKNNENNNQVDKAYLLTKRNNLRSQISKIKTKINTIKGEKKETAKLKLSELEKELLNLENALK